MTGKRFKLIPYGDITYGLFDCVKKEYVVEHLPIRFEGICDILNELHEENQYLKSIKWNQDCINEISIGMQQRQLLEKENEQLRKDATILIQSNQDYRKENEQLKKRIDRIDIILDDLNGAEYISRDDAIKALNKIDKVVR